MSVRVVTDSASDLTDEEASALGITIVPLSIRFGEEELVDRIELGADEFYARMAASDRGPGTAAPPPGAFKTAFDNCFEDGANTVVCINLSSGVSATLEAAEVGARELGDRDIRIIDSRSVTSGLGTMVLTAGRTANNGASAEEVVSVVESLKQRTYVYAALDTLENLKKGGRIGNAQALLGNMLSIKPIIDFSSGVVEEAAKLRTRKKSLVWLRDKLVEHGDRVENLSVMHAQAADIEDFLELLATVVDPSTTRVGSLGPVVASHAGPGVVGMCFTLGD
ncbi:MAG: DegV family protein [Acidimicrobiales bacterium]|nr:DegV family protein [Acidimicrobiales bacterium]